MIKIYTRKRINKKNKIIISSIVIIAIIAIFLSINSNRKITKIESILKDITMTTNKVITYPFTKQKKEVNQDENYLIQKELNESLKQEIKELKELLELNTTLTEYEVENATILSRNKSYWFNTLSIDKGKKDGLKKNMAVITSNGLIGKISKVYGYYSEVKLITSNDVNYKVSVSIKINNHDNYAILNGYDEDNNLLKVTGVSKTTEAKKGDVVVTSGLGELFPSGIYVGEVEKVTNDKYDLSKTVYIKTNQDFNNIHYVSILKGKE